MSARSSSAPGTFGRAQAICSAEMSTPTTENDSASRSVDGTPAPHPRSSRVPPGGMRPANSSTNRARGSPSTRAPHSAKRSAIRSYPARTAAAGSSGGCEDDLLVELARPPTGAAVHVAQPLLTDAQPGAGEDRSEEVTRVVDDQHHRGARGEEPARIREYRGHVPDVRIDR